MRYIITAIDNHDCLDVSRPFDSIEDVITGAFTLVPWYGSVFRDLYICYENGVIVNRYSDKFNKFV